MKVSGRKTGSALSHAPDDWYAVDWRRVERNVRGMQIRIAKATREGKWRSVKALQRMLTRTLSAKLYAVRRVTQNQGARTAGVDRELWDSPITARPSLAPSSHTRTINDVPYGPPANLTALATIRAYHVPGLPQD
jgi:RNA-directed DNA polymerase